LWVDLDDRSDGDTIAAVAALLGLQDVDLQRIAKDDERAHLTRTSAMLHLTLEAMEETDDDPPRLIRREIDVVAAPNIVLTVHDGPIDALQRFRDGLEGDTSLGSITAADLMSALVDEVLVGYYLIAELVERQIDDLDARALRGRHGDDILAAMVELRRRIGIMRRVLAPHRDAFSALGLPELGTDEAIGRPWPGLIDRLEGAMQAVESLRTGLLGTFDIHMGRVTQRANDVMRTLTLLSAVLLPSVVLAGVMGMNFRVGFFEAPTNFWLVVAAMGALAVTVFAIARIRHWL
jgi:magnesium transporter